MYTHTKKQTGRKISKLVIRIFILFLAIVVTFGIYRVAVAFPSVYGVSKIDSLNLNSDPQINWPSYGQSAVGVKGFGVLGASNENAKPIPMASVTKVVTALAILKEKPLQIGEQGGEITIKNSDVELFNKYQAMQGVVVDIKPGQKITQYKALEYMLIMSANNIADVAAIWAYGSIEEYLKQANTMLLEMGLTNIKVADASGFSPQSIATAAELISLGDIALQNPVIAEIVAKDYVSLPDGTQRINTNPFLNYENNGVIGIKNGLTDEAGGVLLAAANRKVDGTDVIIITAVMGSEKYFDAQKDAVALIEPTVRALSQSATIDSGKTVGYYVVPWGGDIPVATKDTIELDEWSDALNDVTVDLYPVTESKKTGDVVGVINVTSSQGTKHRSEVVLTQDLNHPGMKWRLYNPTK